MERLTSLERAKKTLELSEPDRVPLFELLIDSNVINKILPDSSYEDFVDYIGLDLVLTGSPSIMYDQIVLDESKKITIDEWGIKRQFSEQKVAIPFEGPIKNREDLLKYKAPDPISERRFVDLMMLIDRFKGKKAIGIHLHDAFSYPWYLRCMENIFMDFILNPDIVKELIRISIEHNIMLAEKTIKLGADVVVLGDDYGSTLGPMFSPEHFEKFLLPGLREIVKAIKNSGAYCIKHCCGNINILLDMIVNSGINALHPLDMTTNMNIDSVKKKYGEKICVIGGMDCGELLCNDSRKMS